MFRAVRIYQLTQAVFCLALFRVTVFASTAPQEKTFEPGTNITLVCGNRHFSSSTLLSWSKDEIILLNTTSSNSSLVLSSLTAESAGLYICTANTSKILKRVRLVTSKDGQEGQEELPEEEDKGLTNVDYTAIALGLGLTTFFVVSFAGLLYRAERRRKNEYYTKRWRVTVRAEENLAVEEEKPTNGGLPRKDFYVRNAPRAPHKSARPYGRPAEYHWLETLGRTDDQTDGKANRPGGPMWQFTEYV